MISIENIKNPQNMDLVFLKYLLKQPSLIQFTNILRSTITQISGENIYYEEFYRVFSPKGFDVSYEEIFLTLKPRDIAFESKYVGNRNPKNFYDSRIYKFADPRFIISQNPACFDNFFQEEFSKTYFIEDSFESALEKAIKKQVKLEIEKDMGNIEIIDLSRKPSSYSTKINLKD